jgi:hypothetical protein
MYRIFGHSILERFRMSQINRWTDFDLANDKCCRCNLSQGRRQGGLWGAEAPPPKRGMGAHARGVDRGMEGWWWVACGKNVKSYNNKKRSSTFFRTGILEVGLRPNKKGRQIFRPAPPPPKLISPYALDLSFVRLIASCHETECVFTSRQFNSRIDFVQHVPFLEKNI